MNTDIFDLRVIWPSLALLALLLTGFGFGLWGIATTSGLEFQAYLLNTIWCALCIVPVAASVAVGSEREQWRERARAEAHVDAEILYPNGDVVPVRSRDLSLSGARVALDGTPTEAGAGPVMLAFKVCGERLEIPATLLRWEGDEAFLGFEANDLATELAIARVFFGRPDAWVKWDHWPEDKPLRSLAILVRCTFSAVFAPYRFRVGKLAPARALSPPAAARVSRVLRPRYGDALVKPAMKTAAAALACALIAGAAVAQPAVNTGLNVAGLAPPPVAELRSRPPLPQARQPPPMKKPSSLPCATSACVGPCSSAACPTCKASCSACARTRSSPRPG